MPIEDEQQFLAERLQDLDPTLDTTEGSLAWIKVIDPVTRRYTPDPLTVDARRFIRTRLRTEYPDLGVGEAGSPFADIFADPLELLLEPFRREIAAIKSSQSLADEKTLTEQEMDGLASNVFATRNSGGRAVTTARIYFPQAQALTLDGTSYALTDDGKRFYVSELSRITAEQMAANQEDDLYYFDVLVEAEFEGASYNISAGQINSVVGIPTAVKVTNPRAATGGADREDNAQFKARMEDSVSARTPDTDRGIRSVLMDAYGDIEALTTIGYGDIEMERDIIRGNVDMVGSQFGLGPVVETGFATPTPEQLPSASGQLTEGMTSLLILSSPATDISPGDTILIDGEDRVVLDIDGSGTLVHVEDFIVVLATDRNAPVGLPGDTGERNPISVPRASDLSFTNLFVDATAPFITSGVVGGHYLMLLTEDPVTTWRFRDDLLREIEGPQSDQQLKLVGDIQYRRQGYGVDQAGLTDHVTLYFVVGTASNLDDFTVGDVLEWDTGRTGDLAMIDKDNGIMVLENVDSAAYGDLATGVQIRRQVDPTNDYVYLDDPAVTGGLSISGAVVTIDPRCSYDFETSYASAGPAVRVGDFICLTELIPDGMGQQVVYGPFQIDSITGSTQMQLSAVTVPGETTAPTFPASSGSYSLAWTVVDGVVAGGSLDKFYQAKEDPGAYLILSFADYAQPDAGFNYLDYNDPVATFSTRRTLTEDDVLANLILTISDIPGGILFPNTPQGTIEISDEEVHVGGMTDIYEKPTSPEEAYYTLPTVGDNDPFLSGEDLNWPGGGSEEISSTEFIGQELIGKVLVIQEGEYAGSYRIIGRVDANTVRIDFALTSSGSATRFYVTDSITVDMTAPRIDRLVNQAGTSGLNTNLGPYVKAGPSTGYTNFSRYGVSVGDTLEITDRDSPDKGEYTILEILDGGETLRLNQSMTYVTSGLAYDVYRKMVAISFPIIRVRTVDLLDADGSELGLTVPPKDPVDCRSGELSNAGLGVKLPIANTNRSDPSATEFEEDTNPSSDYFGRFYMEDPEASFVNEGIVPSDVLVVLEGVNQGHYIVYGVTPTRIYIETSWPQTTSGAQDDYSIGAPSLGTVRCYFLEPTFFEVSEGTRFKDSYNREFRGDIFARASVAEYTDETADAETGVGTGNGIYSPTVDFQLDEAEVDDRVRVTTVALETEEFTTNSVNVDGTRLTLQFEGESERTVIFQHPDGNPIPLKQPGYPGGVKEQIENTFEDLVVEMSASTPPYKMLLHSEKVFSVKGGTATEALKMTNIVRDEANEHPDAGEYLIESFDQNGHQINVTNLDGTAVTLLSVGLTGQLLDRTRLIVERARTQRIGPSAMTDNQDANGLYYFDVDVMSVQPGNEYNLVDNTELVVEDYRSMGYALSSRNEALTYSTAEELDLVVTPYVMDPLGNDRFSDLIMIPSKEFRFFYDRSPTVQSSQSFVTSDYRRVINNNPLTKHHQPAYVRLVLEYSRGASRTIIRNAIVDHINALVPTLQLSTYQINSIMTRNGAEIVTSPLELIAMVHQMDRSIRTLRTQDRLSTNRTTHVIADEDWVSITRFI